MKAALVGRENVEVTHIQYADDTFFVVDGCNDNAVALKWLLKNFEALSGLAVNFDKSCVFGINMEQDRLSLMAESLGCRLGEGLIPYLGFKIGGRMYGMEAWRGVIDKVRGKLLLYNLLFLPSPCTGFLFFLYLRRWRRSYNLFSVVSFGVGVRRLGKLPG